MGTSEEVLFVLIGPAGFDNYMTRFIELKGLKKQKFSAKMLFTLTKNVNSDQPALCGFFFCSLPCKPLRNTIDYKLHKLYNISSFEEAIIQYFQYTYYIIIVCFLPLHIMKEVETLEE